MKATFLLAALCAGPVAVIAQTIVRVGECSDLPSTITTDTTYLFTEQEVIGYRKYGRIVNKSTTTTVLLYIGSLDVLVRSLVDVPR